MSGRAVTFMQLMPYYPYYLGSVMSYFDDLVFMSFV